MKLFNLILCAFALVNGEENNADGVLQRSEQETDYIDADFEAELKMGRNHGRGNGRGQGGRGQGGRGEAGQGRGEGGRGQGRRQTTPATTSVRNIMRSGRINEEDERKPRECYAKELTDKGRMTFNCRRTKGKMAKNGFTKVCRIRCGNNKKLRNNRTPATVYCNKQGWVNRKNVGYDTSNFGCLPPKIKGKGKGNSYKDNSYKGYSKDKSKNNY